MKPRKPFTPTKRCPHPWCRKIHLINTMFGLVALGSFLWYAGWAYYVFTVLMIIIGTQVTKIAWKGKSQLDIAVEDAASQASGGAGNATSRNLIVRPVWANIAVGMDAVVVFNAFNFAWQLVAGHTGSTSFTIPTSSLEAFLIFVIFGGAIWFWEFAHRKATEPAKPLKLPVLAPTPDQG